MINRINIKKIISFFAAVIFIYAINISPSYAQNEDKGLNEDKQENLLLDEIVAIVGNKIILKSDLDASLAQYRMEVGIAEDDDVVKARILEQLLQSKLLIHFGEVDSVDVSDQQIDQTLDYRINMFINQAGSVKTFEEYYGKPLSEIKEDMRVGVKEQLISQAKYKEIIQDVQTTPKEVKAFFKQIPKDSVPIIPPKYQFGQITQKPIISDEVRQTAMDKITRIRDRIINGEKFEVLARLYSEDPGSAQKGGELGLTKRGSWDPAFTTSAFKLKPDEISEVVESKFGLHILKYIERKGDKINVRHILILLKPSDDDKEKAINKLDSVANLIRIDTITFEQALLKYSDDPGRFTGGLMINQNTGNSFFNKDELDRSIAYELDKMDVGDISSVVSYKDENGDDAYRILYLKTKTLPHKANLQEDYDVIQQWFLNKKQDEAKNEWINEKIKVTYIRLNKEFADYKFKSKWIE